jgi:hypothetical protein
MDPRKTLIIDTFQKAVSRRDNKETRLHNGLRLRVSFQEALERGEVPDHPRFTWLRKQSRTLLELLLAMAADYDKSNVEGNDRASVADLLDISNMTLGLVSGIVQEGVLDPEDVELIPFDQISPQLKTDDEEE